MTEQPPGALRTAAGRAFLDRLIAFYRPTPDEAMEGILAIEAEAREGGFSIAIKRSLKAIQRDGAETAQPALPDMPHYTHRDQHGNVIENYHVCGCQPAQPAPLDIERLAQAYHASQ